ncbi:PPC domain-containing protein [bacterium]|nr:PPC domain-containing protein [bacterium]
MTIVVFTFFFVNINSFQTLADEWDSLDDFAIGATLVEIPTNGSGSHGPHTVNSNDFEDWFTFTLQAGILYEFSSDSEITISGDLLSADAETIVANDLIDIGNEFGANAPNFRFTYTPDATNVYFLRIRNSLLDEGSYTFNFLGDDGTSPGDEWDPIDDSSLSATDLGALSTEEMTHGPHSLSARDTEDWFVFQVVQDAAILIKSESNADIIGELYSTSGFFRIAADDNSGENSNFSIRYNPTSNGQLWLRVTLGENEVRADYSLRLVSGVEPPEGGDAWDPQDDVPEGGTLLGDPTDEDQAHGPHTLLETDIADYFIFTLQGGYEYEFYSSGNYNTVGELLLADGVTQVSLDEVSGDGNNFKITFGVSETAKYILHVREFANSFAVYQLHYRRTASLPEPPTDDYDPADNLPSGATALATPTMDEQIHDGHTLSIVDPVDWYKVSLSAGSTYEFWSSGASDTLATIYDAQQQPLVQFDEGGAQSNFRGQFTPDVSGEYYIDVRLYDTAATGAYSLHYRQYVPPASEGDAWDPEDDALIGATQLAEANRNGLSHGPHRLTPGDSDWFQLVLTEGVYYEFFSTGGSDTAAQLYLPDGATLVASDEDGGASTNFNLQYTAQTTGVYYLRVFEEIGADGVYDLNYFSNLDDANPYGALPVVIHRLNSETEYTPYPGGFTAGTPAGEVSVGSVASSGLIYSDASGAVIRTDPGEVMLLQFPDIEVGDGLLLIRASVRSTTAGAQVWLAALDSSLNGSAASTMIADSGEIQSGYQRMLLLYNPPSGTAAPIVQVANISGSEQVGVLLDTVEAYVVPADQTWSAELFFPNTQAPAQANLLPQLAQSFSLAGAPVFTEVPGGFSSNPVYPGGELTTGEIIVDGDRESDGLGVTIKAAPGQVHLITFPSVEVGDAVALIRATVRTSASGAQVALAALDASIDGSISADIPADSAIFQDGDHVMTILYDPNTSALIPLIQLANLPGQEDVELYIDNLEIYTLPSQGGIPGQLLGE